MGLLSSRMSGWRDVGLLSSWIATVLVGRVFGIEAALCEAEGGNWVGAPGGEVLGRLLDDIFSTGFSSPVFAIFN